MRPEESQDPDLISWGRDQVPMTLMNIEADDPDKAVSKCVRHFTPEDQAG